MATTGTEKHFRLCLLLSKAGTKACRTLLLQRVKDLCPEDHEPFPWSLDDFLRSIRHKIVRAKLGKEKIRVLFPGGKRTESLKWDLSLLCCILTRYCELSSLTLIDVEKLGSLRNELCHVPEPTVDDNRYKDYLEMIKVIVGRIMEQTNDESTKSEVRRIILDVEKKALSLEDTLREMHKFYAMESDIREKLDQMSEVEKAVLSKVEKFDRLLNIGVKKLDSKLDMIDQKLEDKKRRSSNSFVLPDMELHIELKNLNPDQEKYFSAVLVELFEATLAEDEHFRSKPLAESYEKLREVVRKTVRAFVCKGWQIVETKQKCVQLNIRCTSFASQAALFQECIEGGLERQLKDLESVISQLTDEEDVVLEPVIYKDDFWSIMLETLSLLEVYLSEDPEKALLLKANDANIGTVHSLLLTARRIVPEQLPKSTENCDKGDIQSCLKELETELGKTFGEADLFMRVNPVQMIGVTEEMPDLGNATAAIKESEEFEERGQMQDISRLSSVDEFFAFEAEDRENTEENVIQTIAILELYRAQLSVATHLELAYLKLYDNLDIANEVHLVASSAKDLHEMSAHMIRDMQTNATLIKTKFSLLSDAISVQTAWLLEIRLHEIMPLIKHMKAETEKAITIDKDTQKLVKECNRRVSERRQHSKEKSLDHQFKQFLEYAQEERNEAMQIILDFRRVVQIKGENYIPFEEQHLYEKKASLLGGDNEERKELKLKDKNEIESRDLRDTLESHASFKGAEAPIPEAEASLPEAKAQLPEAVSPLPGAEAQLPEVERTIPEFQNDEGSIRTINGALLTATFRPGTAMTGGIKGTVLERHVPRNIFDIFHHSDKKELHTLLTCYVDSQRAKSKTLDPVPSVTVKLCKQHTEALQRLDTLQRLDKEGFGDVGCLREVLSQLEYIEIQLSRMADGWSNMLTLMETMSEMLSGDLSCFDVSFFRFVNLNANICLDWDWFEEICQNYAIENDNQMEDMYKFLLVPVETMTAKDRTERVERLLLDVENRLKRTDPTGFSEETAKHFMFF